MEGILARCCLGDLESNLIGDLSSVSDSFYFLLLVGPKKMLPVLAFPLFLCQSVTAIQTQTAKLIQDDGGSWTEGSIH